MEAEVFIKKNKNTKKKQVKEIGGVDIEWIRTYSTTEATQNQLVLLFIHVHNTTLMYV